MTEPLRHPLFSFVVAVVLFVFVFWLFFFTIFFNLAKKYYAHCIILYKDKFPLLTIRLFQSSSYRKDKLNPCYQFSEFEYELAIILQR